MNGKMIFLAIFLLLFTVCLIRVLRIVNKKKRFSNNALIKAHICELTQYTVNEILKLSVSDQILYKVLSINIEVAEDYIISDSGSIFFKQERMRLLEMDLDRNLMLSVIIKGMKKELRKRFPRDPVNGFAYKIQVGYLHHSKELVSCSKATIYYIVPNEAYIPPKKW